MKISEKYFFANPLLNENGRLLSLVLLDYKNLQILFMPISNMSIVGNKFSTTLHNGLLIS